MTGPTGLLSFQGITRIGTSDCLSSSPRSLLPSLQTEITPEGGDMHADVTFRRDTTSTQAGCKRIHSKTEQVTRPEDADAGLKMLTLICSALNSSFTLSTYLRGSSSADMSGKLSGPAAPARLLAPCNRWLLAGTPVCTLVFPCVCCLSNSCCCGVGRRATEAGMAF